MCIFLFYLCDGKLFLATIQTYSCWIIYYPYLLQNNYEHFFTNYLIVMLIYGCLMFVKCFIKSFIHVTTPHVYKYLPSNHPNIISIQCWMLNVTSENGFEFLRNSVLALWGRNWNLPSTTLTVWGEKWVIATCFTSTCDFNYELNVYSTHNSEWPS